MTSDFKTELAVWTERAEAAVKKWLPADNDYPGVMPSAMRYSVLAGGKRLRPLMLLYICESAGGNLSDAEPFAAAMEFIHTSSLVHDDLPAIDNDELRRGKPTTHAAFGESAAILAGDALLNYAYEVIIKGIAMAGCKEGAVKAADVIARRSGVYGMLGGQGLDVESDKGTFFKDGINKLDYTYERKTAALIEASLMAGAYLAGAEEETVSALERIGHDIGMAFQIQDDILDVTSDSATLGKPVFSDQKNNKNTYVTLLSTEGAREKAEEYAMSALNEAASLPFDSTFLKGIINYLNSRKF